MMQQKTSQLTRIYVVLVCTVLWDYVCSVFPERSGKNW